MATESLLVQAGTAIATSPLDRVRHCTRIPPDAVAYAGRRATVAYEGVAIPLLPLAGALGAESEADRAAGSTGPVAVVVEASTGDVAALGVGRLLGAAEVVVQPLPELTPAGELIGGVSWDSQGSPRIVLNTDAAVALAREALAPPPAVRARPPVLVIDDSLTTRMLEQSILATAGYDVDLACSAEEGLAKAQANRYALFLVDVEMPGMDGFTFIERARADARLRDVPSILVSSRMAPEDRQRGLDAGARLYVAKSEFDQSELLGQIRSLVG
jgi:two-component system chemotaxis sensor kinase CheA